MEASKEKCLLLPQGPEDVACHKQKNDDNTYCWNQNIMLTELFLIFTHLPVVNFGFRSLDYFK